MDLATSYLPTLTGKPASVLFDRINPLVAIEQAPDGTQTITLWKVDGVAEPSEADLAAALAAPAPGPTAAQLVAYAQAKQAALSTGGLAFNVAASGAPPEIALADTSVIGRLDLSGLVQLADMNSAFTTTWLQSTGNLTLTATQIIALGVGVGQFIEATYQALGVVLAGIAGGTITTTAAIDAAAWPASA